MPLSNPTTPPIDATRWYVMRVYKQEMQAEKALNSPYGLEHFIAKQYTTKTIHGKKTRILTPAIPNIIFVHATRIEIKQFKEYFPTIRYCYSRSIIGPEHPLIVPDKDMAAFITIARQMEEDITYHSPDDIQLNKGDKVRVHGGPFDGLEGTLLKVKGKRSKRIVVKIEGITAISSAEITPDLIEVL